MAGAVGVLHVVTTVGGATATDETLAPTALPHEIRLAPPQSDLGAAVAVRVDAYSSPAASAPFSGQPILVRTAEARFVPGRTELLRVFLQGACLLGLPGGPPGGPTCASPQTCIAQRCQDDAVPPQGLEAYSPGWAARAPDACGSAGSGAPVVQVGTGQSDYLPLSDGQTVRMEQGPQGGHHIWIAVRQENLKQLGSTTTITSVQPRTGAAGPRTSYVFTFDPDQGGFCKLAGLRYQLDVDRADYHQFLGQPLDVTVTIAEEGGRSGAGIAHVNIDSQLVCLSADSGC